MNFCDLRELASQLANPFGHPCSPSSYASSIRFQLAPGRAYLSLWKVRRNKDTDFYNGVYIFFHDYPKNVQINLAVRQTPEGNTLARLLAGTPTSSSPIQIFTNRRR